MAARLACIEDRGFACGPPISLCTCSLCCCSGQSAEPELPVSEGSEDEEEQAAAAVQERHGGGRQRFVVPHRQQQQQQQPPKTPLDLGLRSSPTIVDLLDGEAAAASSSVQDEASQQLPSLGCSPVAEQAARPSQRLWLPQRMGPTQREQQQQQQEQQRQGLLDLISPAGQQQLALQHAQHQQAQEQPGHGGGGITPGELLWQDRVCWIGRPGMCLLATHRWLPDPLILPFILAQGSTGAAARQALSRGG